jgi:hypothetical protein
MAFPPLDSASLLQVVPISPSHIGDLPTAEGPFLAALYEKPLPNSEVTN